MFCLISLLFILYIVGQLETGQITTCQSLIYSGYALLMLYYTMKPYIEEQKKGGK